MYFTQLQETLIHYKFFIFLFSIMDFLKYWALFGHIVKMYIQKYRFKIIVLYKMAMCRRTTKRYIITRAACMCVTYIYI